MIRSKRMKNCDQKIQEPLASERITLLDSIKFGAKIIPLCQGKILSELLKYYSPPYVCVLLFS